MTRWKGSLKSRLFARRGVFYEEGDAGARHVIKPDVHGVQARFGELQLLDAGGEVARDEMKVFRQRDIKGDLRKIRHDAAAVGIDEIDSQLVRALVAGHEGGP